MEKIWDRQDHFLKDKEFMKKLWRLAFPIALQNLMLASVAAADAVMLGNLSQNAMSAVSMATQIQFIQNMMLCSAVSAFVILGAQYWGKGELKPLQKLFGMALRFCGITSVLFFVGCVFFPRYLMLLFTSDAELVGIGVGYLKIAGWSYLLTGISQCYLALTKVTEHARDTAIVSGGAVIVNIVLNAVFIFGLCGAPAMEARGAALSTLISRIVELLWSVGLSFRKGYVCPSPKYLFGSDRLLRRSFVRCILPLLGAVLSWGVGFTSYTAFMGHISTDAAGANSVAAVVRDLVCCLCNGVASGGGILVGNELGAGDLAKGKLYGNRLLVISFLCGFLSTAIMLAVTPVLLRLVKLTDGARELLLGMMVIMAFYMIGRCVNTVVINGVFSAGGDTMFDLYSLTVTMWMLAVPLAAAGTFLFHWHPLVVYGCTCLDEVGKIPWVMLHHRKYKWVKDLTVKEESPVSDRSDPI